MQVRHALTLALAATSTSLWRADQTMPDKHNNPNGILLPRRWQHGAGLAALLGLQLLLPACATDPSAGRALFDRQCSQCHHAGAAALKTPAARVPELLGSGTIRPHRFKLDDTQLRDIAAYLEEVQASGH